MADERERKQRAVPEPVDEDSFTDVFGAELWEDTRGVVDEAHRLLGSEMIGGTGDPAMVRVTFEIPKGLMLVAEYVTAREVFKQDMDWMTEALADKGAEGKAARGQSQLFLAKCLTDALHEELHYLATGGHRLLRDAADKRGWKREKPPE
jgi:hypothetical protein